MFACVLCRASHFRKTESPQCRYGPVQPDRYLLYADRMISGSSQTAATCQAACDSERHFRCRSFSVHSAVPSTPMQCSLSSSISPTYEVISKNHSSHETILFLILTSLNDRRKEAPKQWKEIVRIRWRTRYPSTRRRTWGSAEAATTGSCPALLAATFRQPIPADG